MLDQPGAARPLLALVRDRERAAHPSGDLAATVVRSGRVDRIHTATAFVQDSHAG